MIVFPNVKINLGLNVLRRRPDGYHDIETLFVPYPGISDVLEVVAGDDYSRSSASLFAAYGNPGAEDVAEDGPRSIVQGMSEDGKLMITIARKEGVDWNPLDDLCAKAYFLLAGDFALPPVKIFLEKRSPVGAGLGGGSSDAAFALKALNEMFSLGLDSDELASYASRLGSDCAFFIHNRPMFGSGRGEILEDYSLKEPVDSCGNCDTDFEIRVVIPENIAVSTADAYRGIVPSVPDIPLKEVLALPPEKWKGTLKNDFEATVFAKYPELERLKESLYDSGAVYAAMSGSGSALFGIYRK